MFEHSVIFGHGEFETLLCEQWLPFA